MLLGKETMICDSIRVDNPLPSLLCVLLI